VSWLLPSALAIGGVAAAIVLALHFIARSRPLAEPLPTARFIPQRPIHARTRSIALTDVLLMIVRVAALLALAATMLLFDALENRELLFLSTAAPSPEMDASLGRLHLFTLLKWYAIFGSAGLLAPFLWREPDWWRFAGPVFGLAALLGVVGLAHRPGIEWGARVIAIAWLLTWLHALRRA